ncbi:MAG: hypothetical protein IKN55_02340 [Oscillospiraceae bacterium]|nr:hypothetical protein [Oscillospiraceae bacterium]
MHRNSLLGASPAASFLYNLTKNLTAHLHHQLCAVLPELYPFAGSLYYATVPESAAGMTASGQHQKGLS